MPLCAPMWRRAVSRPDAETLRAAVAALIGDNAASQDRFGVAVSGGADSLALLLLAHAAFPGRVAAASVDHRLRAEAAGECAHVAAICASLGVPHSILTPASPPLATQADARTLRYALLDTWRRSAGLNWLMTAHHADDQLETLIMRLNRSSGVAGLAGVRARNGSILRPLLGERRDALAKLVAAAGLIPVDDPANRDPRYDRARLRQAMAGQDWLDPVAATHSAGHLADAEEALVWAVRRLLPDHVQQHAGGTLFQPADVPAELRLRMVTALLQQMGAPSLRHGEVARLIAAVAAGGAATLGGVMVRADPRGAGWWFRPAPPHRGAKHGAA